MSFRQNNNGSPVQKVLDFLQKNWIVLVGAIVAYPLIVRLMRTAEAKDKVAEVEAEKQELEAVNATPETQRNALAEITSNTGYHTAAKDLAHHLGFIYPWYDPRSWTENDQEAFEVISNSPCGINIDDTLIDCYYLVTNGRNMYNDCREVLKNSLFNQLNW